MSITKWAKNPIYAYRFAHTLWSYRAPLLPSLITYFIRLFYSCYLPHQARIGKGCVLAYGGLGIVIHQRAVIGDNCHINQGVTIGGTSKNANVPRVGDNVFIGAGAIVLGDVNIGSNSVIGANAVVVRDVDSGSLMVGVPAKKIKSGIKKSDYV
ncbi:serine O-acetyltransferase [Oricola sp.]|uniref:serine O-acetyltransferase n=1 Tax=Oricola sp. TaxID=1979950 RepID=UPI003BABB667